MLPTHAKVAPTSKYIGKEFVTIQTLDALFSSYCKPDSRVFLKIDTQGFTKKVLEGGQHSLETIRGLQVEMSLVPLYEGEPLMGELVSFLQCRGFTPIFVFPEFIDNQQASSCGQWPLLSALITRRRYAHYELLRALSV
jgi:hypothetical protein